jgi:tetratricopeptide (TPR) repeat protein
MPGAAVSKADVLHARGWALYVARRDYAKASDLLEQASKLGSKDPARDLFYAARARSRAHEDERAIRLYGELARRYRGSYWAEQADYLSARLHYIAGRWNEASAAYETYLRRYREGRNIDPARHEQAVAWPAAGVTTAPRSSEALADASNSEHEAALYRELIGVAQTSRATSNAQPALASVIRQAPLVWRAAAASRLSAMGEPRPAPIEPGPSDPVRLTDRGRAPRQQAACSRTGLDDDAERELEEPKSRSKRPMRRAARRRCARRTRGSRAPRAATRSDSAQPAGRS